MSALSIRQTHAHNSRHKVCFLHLCSSHICTDNPCHPDSRKKKHFLLLIVFPLSAIWSFIIWFQNFSLKPHRSFTFNLLTLSKIDVLATGDPKNSCFFYYDLSLRCHHEECTNDNPGLTLSNLQESCSPPSLNGEICHKNYHNKRIQYVTTICEFHFKS